jgi:hypothetical protein
MAVSAHQERLAQAQHPIQLCRVQKCWQWHLQMVIAATAIIALVSEPRLGGVNSCME